jgi:predicted house-cleaning noncanonical NTP pyrophosphatase (MazG superfamily)
MAYEEWLYRLTDDPKSSIIDMFRKNSMTTKVNWSHEYSKQRKDRMQDAIDDYLNDDKVSARQTYEEMLSGIDDVINYHKISMERAVELKSLMLGHREIDFIQE